MTSWVKHFWKKNDFLWMSLYLPIFFLFEMYKRSGFLWNVFSTVNFSVYLLCRYRISRRTQFPREKIDLKQYFDFRWRRIKFLKESMWLYSYGQNMQSWFEKNWKNLASHASIYSFWIITFAMEILLYHWDWTWARSDHQNGWTMVPVSRKFSSECNILGKKIFL